MRLTLPLLALAGLALTAAPAGSLESAADFWRAEHARRAAAPPPVPTRLARKDACALVAQEATRRLGREWAPVAVRIAWVESRCNPAAVGPKTRHGRAQGIMQVMPGSARALGYDPRRLREARYGAAAGVAHMRACIASGVRTERQMAACHVAGVKGWQKRLRPSAERYKRQYVGLVMGARL
jgi:soluble lytic murein transglycosylase-like protein